MDRRMLRSILDRLGVLEKRSTRYRQGVVTSLSPLSVELGGSDTAYTDVRSLAGAPLAVGDTVAVLTFGHDLLVLGALTSTPDNLRVERGIIDMAGAGSILEGTGFGITRHGTGDLTVTFTSAFGDLPSVEVSAYGSADRSASLSSATALTTSACRISRITASTGAPTDGIVHFTAVGPR